MTEVLTIRERSFHWGKRTYVMGILNVTPDSFSDGGEFNTPGTALAQAELMVAAGADIIDIGGQSTRPGAGEISVEEELTRVVPAIRALREKSSIPISLDTTRAVVAEKGIEAGADIVNDISGGTFDPELLPTVARSGVAVVLAHTRGRPSTMQGLTEYRDLIAEVGRFLAGRVETAFRAGIPLEKIIIDPGIGFAKTGEQNLEILRELDRFKTLHRPLLIGVSRKRFIGQITGKVAPKERVWGTAAANCAAIAAGADILRVHDVAPTVDTCKVADAIWRV